MRHQARRKGLHARIRIKLIGFSSGNLGVKDLSDDMVAEMYACLNCKKDVEIDINRTKKIICPFCGYRILKKKRAQTTKKVIVK